MDDSKLVPTPSSAARRQTDFTTAERQSLVQPHSRTLHPMKDHLVLAAWKLSGNPLDTEAFLTKQPVSLHWTSGTDKQYNSAWKQWCSWCKQRKIDTLQPPVNEVANFVSKCFADGKSYINSYRSALSSSLYPLITPLLGPIHFFPDFSRGCTMFALRFRGTPPHGT